MSSHISLSDTDATIGEAHLAVVNPVHLLPVTESIEDIRLLVADLFSNQLAFTQRIHELERRVSVLESRTWWSLLKAQVISWFRHD